MKTLEGILLMDQIYKPVSNFPYAFTDSLNCFRSRAVGKYPDFSSHAQLPTHFIHERKQHFIAYKSVSLFLMRSVYTRSFEHVNKEGIRDTMDSKLEEQRSIIKFLFLEGDKPCHIFKKCRLFF